MNKKGLTLAADVYATMGVILLLVIYVLIMSENKPDIVDSVEIKGLELFNLYAFLETPVGDGKVKDLIKSYAESDYTDDNLKESIIESAEEIFKKLNICADKNVFFSILVLREDGDDKLKVFYPLYAKSYYELLSSENVFGDYVFGDYVLEIKRGEYKNFEPALFNYLEPNLNKFDFYSVVQRIPYKNGVVEVMYYFSYTAHGSLQTEGCEEVLDYE
jgi:hypothetical protein